MERRIANATTHSDLLQTLVEPVPGEEYPLFETKQKALMFAAALGAQLRGRTTLSTRDASSAIRFDIFEKALDDGFVAALAVHDSKELGILSEARQDEFGLIFEEYAHTGLTELQNKVVGQPDPLQALVHLIQDARQPITEEGLEGVDPDVLTSLLGR